MPSDPIPAEPESLAALHEQDARELRVLLLGLARQGGEMATLYVEKAKDQAYDGKPGAGSSPACADSYCDVARSIRQTVMLVQKLTAPAPAAKLVRAEPDKVAIRKQIIRRVEDSIYKDAPEGAAERLHAEMLERMEGAEFEEELGTRPVQEIVNEIRADLAIHGADSALYFKRRPPADIAVLCARASRSRIDSARPFGAATSPCAPSMDAAALAAALLHDGPPIRGP
jgi:CheY-specific phosphatase CheX